MEVLALQFVAALAVGEVAPHLLLLVVLAVVEAAMAAVAVAMAVEVAAPLMQPCSSSRSFLMQPTSLRWSPC